MILPITTIVVSFGKKASNNFDPFDSAEKAAQD